MVMPAAAAADARLASCLVTGIAYSAGPWLRTGALPSKAGACCCCCLLLRQSHGANALMACCSNTSGYCLPAGLVGILLALAGAEVTLSDQPHIVPLADANAQVRAGLVTCKCGAGRAAEGAASSRHGVCAALPAPPRAAVASQLPPSPHPPAPPPCRRPTSLPASTAGGCGPTLGEREMLLLRCCRLLWCLHLKQLQQQESSRRPKGPRPAAQPS